MQVFGVAGAGTDEFVDALLEGLPGQVAVLRDTTPDGGAIERPRGATIYERAADGWRVTGQDLSLAGVIDRLAIDHDYAIIAGLDADVPTVALGGADVGEVLVRAATPAAVDQDELVAAIDDLDPHETLHSLVDQVKDSPAADRAGAIATFTGRVRALDDPADVPTEYLEFETYEDVAGDRMATIATELEDREGVRAVELHHRTGVVQAGEDIVFVVVLAGHREEAFAAVRDGIDRLKDEVPIFKREVTVEETFWVHEE